MPQRKKTRRITLTFDNGPTPGVTDRVLDVLAAHGIRTTFFVIGQKAEAGPDQRTLLERAVRDGHWVGNHTYTHRGLMARLPETDSATVEIARTQTAIAPFAHPDHFYRPCGGGGQLVPGLLTPAAVDLLVSGGYTLVLWNAIPRDWNDPEGWPQRALAQIADLPNTDADWPLLVLHDVEGAALAHLETFLAAVADAGFEIDQRLPPACMPIHRGRIVTDLTPYLG